MTGVVRNRNSQWFDYTDCFSCYVPVRIPRVFMWIGMKWGTVPSPSFTLIEWSSVRYITRFDFLTNDLGISCIFPFLRVAGEYKSSAPVQIPLAGLGSSNWCILPQSVYYEYKPVTAAITNYYTWKFMHQLVVQCKQSTWTVLFKPPPFIQVTFCNIITSSLHIWQRWSE